MKIKYLELEEKEDLYIKEIENPIVFLVNNNHWFSYSFNDKSNYFGYWVKIGNDVFKTIEDLEFVEKVKEIEIINEKEVLFTFENNKAKIYLDSQGLNLEFLIPSYIKIYLDPRILYSTQYFANFNILPNENSFFLSFSDNKNSKKFDFKLIFDGNLKFINKKIKRIYEYDKKRNSKIYEFEIIKGFEGIISKFKIFSLDKKIHTSFFENIEIENLKKFISRRIFSLYDNEFLAGLPWFPQRWFRDELLSITFLNYDFIKEKIIKDYLDNLENWWNKNKIEGELAADTFLLFCNILNKEKILENKDKLINILEKWEKIFMKNGEIFLPPKTTWMDTLNRENAIEIDCLYLKALEKLDLIEKFKSYKVFLKTKIISNLYNESEIYSPNMFLAYFFIKDIFNEIEWQCFFDKIIEKNYLDWGGFSTIDKNNINFKIKHTGENPSSYHSGDSWFFINNIGAWCLKDLNYKKFENIISKIKEASLKNLLELKVPGFMSELSSAESLKHEGSLIQLWSMASLLKIL